MPSSPAIDPRAARRGPGRAGRALLVLLLAWSAGAHAAVRSFRGELVELGCYVNHDGQGPDHAACADRCARAGAPVALKLRGSGRLLIIITELHFVNPAGKAFGYFGVPVTVTGELKVKDGLDFLVLKSVAVTPE